MLYEIKAWLYAIGRNYCCSDFVQQLKTIEARDIPQRVSVFSLHGTSGGKVRQDDKQRGIVPQSVPVASPDHG